MNQFTSSFFVGNRERLAKALPKHFLVFTAHSLVQSAADMAFPFRQDSSFWYITGLNEPDLLLTIDCDSGESTIYLPEQNDYQKEWDGTFDKTEIRQKSGIIKVEKSLQFEKDVKKVLKKGQKIGYLPALPDRVEPYGFYANPSRRILEERLDRLGVQKDDRVDIRKHVAKLRQIKQPIEIEAIQRAIDITGKSLEQIKQKLSTIKTEKDAERQLTAHFLLNGGDAHAFEPIVAAGKNASIIHYEKKQSTIEESDLVLFDVGTQVDGYAADISRVYSVSGNPSDRQKELWQACLEIQQKAFAMLRPGVMMREYQKQLETEADKVFKKLGCSMAGKPFPHGFSHFLGLDPHDAGLYDEPLVAGSVLTVEPGIYLPDEGIGVRVEDNVLITESGIVNLSKNIPHLL